MAIVIYWIFLASAGLVVAGGEHGVFLGPEQDTPLRAVQREPLFPTATAGSEQDRKSGDAKGSISRPGGVSPDQHGNRPERQGNEVHVEHRDKTDEAPEPVSAGLVPSSPGGSEIKRSANLCSHRRHNANTARVGSLFTG